VKHSKLKISVAAALTGAGHPALIDRAGLTSVLVSAILLR
jgi:hypothetical protein